MHKVNTSRLQLPQRTQRTLVSGETCVTHVASNALCIADVLMSSIVIDFEAGASLPLQNICLWPCES